MSNNKIGEIDFLRAISALAVVTIHVAAKFVEIPAFGLLQMSVAYFDNLVGFAVPSFIFISGLVLYRNYGTLKTDIFTFYKKRFAKIIPIYLLFSLFYICYAEFDHIVALKQLHITLGKFIVKLLTGGAHSHLWYFCILFQFYLLYPLFLNLYRRYTFRLLMAVFLLQFAWSFWGTDVFRFVGALIGNGKLSFPIIFSHMFWFVLGFFFVDHKDKILQRVPVWTGFALILVLNAIKTLPMYYGLQHFKFKAIPVHYFNITTVMNPFIFLLEILLAYRLSIFLWNRAGKLTQLLKSIGDYSLEIYLIHAYVILQLLKLMAVLHITCNQLTFYPIVWVATVIVSYGFALSYRWLKLKIVRPKQG
jgi:peptidoglycan/LPS O-acetylase OafA/YrhL